MPGLIACNRRWDVASDDFVFPGLGEIFIRIIWLAAVAVVYDAHRSSFGCSHGPVLHTYCIGMLVVLSLHILLDIAVIAISMQGSIVNSAPRRRLPAVLYLKLLMFIPDFIITMMGTVWAFDLENNCDNTVVVAMRGTALAGWVIFFFLLVGLGMVFDPLGGRRHRHRRADLEDEESVTATKRLWELRCRLLCCCANRDEQSANAFNDIAQLMSDFFKGLDVVPTDIAAGLIMVQLEQAQQPKRLCLEPVCYSSPPASPSHLSPRLVSPASTPDMPGTSNGIRNSVLTIQNDTPFPQPMDWMTISAAAHYMKFANSSYGWMFYLYTHLGTGICRLCGQCRCCACVRSPEYMVEDNCCGCNTAAILKTTDIQEDDIIYASFYNRVYQIPFFVALDHKRQSVVVSIRGTLSLRDALTDMTADCDSLEVPGIEGGYAHKGILQAAKFIQNTLSNLQLLEKAFDRAPGYQLVITGHSLGAGAAGVLSVLLKPQYPSLRCFSFSPPGWLVSLPLSRYTEDFICSVVVGKDLVPRLGFLTLEQLKAHTLRVIRHCNKPKYKVLAGGVSQFLVGSSSLEREVPSSRLLCTSRTSLLSTPNNTRSYTEDEFNQSLDDAIVTCNRASQRHHTPLYLPGHIMYLEEAQRSRSCCSTPLYTAAWARAEVFDQIIVSPRMIQDHVPDVVANALDQMVERGGKPLHVVKIYNPHASVV